MSPDGNIMVWAGDNELLAWGRGGLESIPMPEGGDPEGGVAFSPNGEFIAYSDPVLGQLRATSLSEDTSWTLAHRTAFPPGTEITFEGDPEALYPSWSDDGWVYSCQHAIIYRVPEEGGTPERFTEQVDGIQLFPHALPGGHGLLFSVRMGKEEPFEQNWIAVVDSGGGSPRKLLNGVMAKYATSGHLVYSTVDRKLMAVRFDLERLDTIGGPTVFRESLGRDMEGAGSFDLSGDGTLFLPGLGGQGGGRWWRCFGWLGLDGTNRVDSTWTGRFFRPRLSPNDRRVAVVDRREGQDHIWIYALDGSWEGQASPGGINDSPSWTTDGEFLTFVSDFGGQKEVWTVPSNFERPPRMILHRDREIAEAVWSPDGRWLVFTTDPEEVGRGDILAIAANPGDSVPSSAVAIPVATDLELTESRPTFSPDGRWLAYTVSQPGDAADEIPDELWVARFQDPVNQRWPLDTGGGSPMDIAWAHSGREIFVQLSGGLWAVEVDTTRAPSDWGSSPLGSVGLDVLYRGWDVGRDDQSFLVLPNITPRSPGSLYVFENFFDELRRELGG